MSALALVDVHDLTVRFGGVTAVDGVTLSIHPCEIVGIIGPNGAGKSSLLQALAGQVPVSHGSIHFDGKNVTKLAASERARLGVCRTFQTTSEFSGLTVFENLLVAGMGPSGSRLGQAVWSGRGTTVRRRECMERAWTLLEEFEMKGQADLYGRELSGGQRRLLEVMRCVIQNPRVILLDEPMVGVAAHLVDRIMSECRSLAERGVAVILVEHALGVVKDVCTRVVVMANGDVIADGFYDDVTSLHAVQAAYLSYS